MDGRRVESEKFLLHKLHFCLFRKKVSVRKSMGMGMVVGLSKVILQKQTIFFRLSRFFSGGG